MNLEGYSGLYYRQSEIYNNTYLLSLFSLTVLDSLFPVVYSL
jgi:hypothetical protein